MVEQVIARWHPEEACRPGVEDAPVFYPTEKVFNVAYNFELFEYHNLSTIVVTG